MSDTLYLLGGRGMETVVKQSLQLKGERMTEKCRHMYWATDWSNEGEFIDFCDINDKVCLLMSDTQCDNYEIEEE